MLAFDCIPRSKHDKIDRKKLASMVKSMKESRSIEICLMVGFPKYMSHYQIHFQHDKDVLHLDSLAVHSLRAQLVERFGRAPTLADLFTSVYDQSMPLDILIKTVQKLPFVKGYHPMDR